MSYTLVSTDVENYNRIHAQLPVNPRYSMVNMYCSNFISVCHIQVLNTDDYIEINDVKIKLNDNYSNITSYMLAELLNELFEEYEIGIEIMKDNSDLFKFISDAPFTINSVSYNMSQVLGLYYIMKNSFPLLSVEKDVKYIYQIKSVGYLLSTPVLYIVSNIGADLYMNSITDERLGSMATLMRIPNTFSYGFPIISSNGSFIASLPINSLGSVSFMLVDANRHAIKILSPIYLTIEVEPIVVTEDPFKMFSPLPIYHPYTRENNLLKTEGFTNEAHQA